MQKMITLTIDNKKVEVEEGSTVLQAAEKLGIKIPTLCHHRSLLPYGACRVCLVELKKSWGSSIQASCVYPAEEGMVVQTDTERVLKTRRMMLELLLARCPDAPRIVEMAKEMGIEEPRFPKKNDNCILCGLCTRVCEERMGIGAISFVNRGSERKVAVPYDKHSPVCITCGACTVVCPTNDVDLSKVTLNKPRPIMADYDMGLVQRSSIYIPFAQAIPKVAVIDKNTCMHFLNDTCKSCENFCEAGAIDYEQQDEIEELDVGAVVLSPGFEQFDPDLKKELGYSRYSNVLSSLQFERLLSASGPYLGKILRISDEKSPGKIAWIQCVGSREVECNYCSSVCCMYATKEAIIAKEHAPDLDCIIFFIDMRA
ncbi:MAG: (2Fe-2S)-binding protein, partial [Planctomycetes bacterium]|nr:(2Fe-2S)-binding protein [Planctomycetota bacterium]